MNYAETNDLEMTGREKTYPATFEKIIAGSAKVRDSRGIVRATSVPGDIWCDMASNDYLGLASDSQVIAAAAAELGRSGCSARASRVVCGTQLVHTLLEAALAGLTGFESALVFSSGYTANMAVLAALGRPGTHIFMDAHIHASLHDAAALSQAEVRLFAHNSVDEAEQFLQEAAGAPCVLVVEGVYSVLGDAADVAAFHALAVRYDALLVVDEAHSLGVRGGGRGQSFESGVAGSQHVILSTSLGKSCGSMGGALICSDDLRDYFVNTARSFIFDTALAPAQAAAALAAVQIIAAEGENLTAQLRANAEFLCAELGIEPAAGAVQSMPVPAGADVAAEISRKLAERGIAVACFRPPAVPDGVSRLRFTAHANTPRPELKRALQEIKAVLADTKGI